MGRIKRGGYIIYWWIGDHGYRIHVKKEGRDIVKYDLENKEIIKGKMPKKLQKIINELIKEGVI